MPTCITRGLKTIIFGFIFTSFVLLVAPSKGDDGQPEPKDAKGFIERGNAFHDKKDYAKAIADYTEAIRRDPKLAEAYGRRANSYQASGEDDKAIVDSTAALKLDSKLFIAYKVRGLAYSHKNDHDQAIKDFTESIKLNPRSVREFYHRGTEYLAKADYDLAIADFTTAIRLDPKYTNAYRKRSEAYSKQGKEDLAKADLQEAERLQQASKPTPADTTKEKAEPKSPIPSARSGSNHLLTAADVFAHGQVSDLNAPDVGPLKIGTKPTDLPKGFKKLEVNKYADRLPKNLVPEREIGIYMCDEPTKIKGFPNHVGIVVAYFAGEHLYKVVYRTKLVYSDLSPAALAKAGLTANGSYSDAAVKELDLQSRNQLLWGEDKTRKFEDLLDYKFVAHPGLTEVRFETFKTLLAGMGGEKSSSYALQVPGGMKVPAFYRSMGSGEDEEYTIVYKKTFTSDLFVYLQAEKWDTIGKKGDPSGTISSRWLTQCHIWIPFEERFGEQYARLKQAEIRVETIRPVRADQFHERGCAYFTLENYDKAITDLTEAIRLDPKCAKAYYYRSLAHKGKGSQAQADLDLNEAKRIKPDIESSKP